MRAQGIDVVDFSVGEPDFPTPEVVKRAAKAALDANFTKYTANDGIPELKRAICGKLERDNGLAYSPDEVIVSAGAKNSLFNVAMALYDEGDDVLIPAPYWVSYPDQVKLAKANPVFVPTREEDGFRLSGARPGGGDHPEHQGAHPQLPVQPDRRDLHPRAARGDRRGVRARADLGDRGRDLREAHLRRAALRLDRLAQRQDQEAHGRDQRLLQGVLDDRVAARLRGGTARDHRRLLQGPVAQHLERDLVRAEGRGHRAGRVRHGRRADAAGVRAPPQRDRLPAALAAGGLVRVSPRARST